MIDKVIKNWIIEIVNDNSWRNHNDLHIDDISDNFVDSKTWINGAFECFGIAKHIRDELKLPFIVELVIILNSKNKPIGINFSSSTELQHELSWTPPSLYLYEKSYETFQNALRKATKIILSDVPFNDIQCYYFETLPVDDPDYYRSVVFVSEP